MPRSTFRVDHLTLINLREIIPERNVQKSLVGDAVYYQVVKSVDALNVWSTDVPPVIHTHTHTTIYYQVDKSVLNAWSPAVTPHTYTQCSDIPELKPGVDNN